MMSRAFAWTLSEGESFFLMSVGIPLLIFGSLMLIPLTRDWRSN